MVHRRRRTVFVNKILQSFEIRKISYILSNKTASVTKVFTPNDAEVFKSKNFDNIKTHGTTVQKKKIANDLLVITKQLKVQRCTSFNVLFVFPNRFSKVVIPKHIKGYQIQGFYNERRGVVGSAA